MNSSTEEKKIVNKELGSKQTSAILGGFRQRKSKDFPVCTSLRLYFVPFLFFCDKPECLTANLLWPRIKLTMLDPPRIGRRTKDPAREISTGEERVERLRGQHLHPKDLLQ